MSKRVYIFNIPSLLVFNSNVKTSPLVFSLCKTWSWRTVRAFVHLEFGSFWRRAQGYGYASGLVSPQSDL